MQELSKEINDGLQVVLIWNFAGDHRSGELEISENVKPITPPPFSTKCLFVYHGVGLRSVNYPMAQSLRGASDPPGHPNYDYIYVSDDLRSLSIKMRTSGMDQIRVLVENTDP